MQTHSRYFAKPELPKDSAKGFGTAAVVVGLVSLVLYHLNKDKD